MAMQLEDVLDLERENETLRDALYLVRTELKLILREPMKEEQLYNDVETIVASIDGVLQ